MTQRAVDYVPLHPDELGLQGETFEVDIDFSYTKDNGHAMVDPWKVSVFVPKQIKDRQAREVGAAVNVLVFFTANNAVGDQDFNDLLTQGLRSMAQSRDWVVIVLPAPGDHAGGDPVPANLPDFCVFHDADIATCLGDVGLSAKVDKIRLVSHSRGFRGMTRSLMGNDEIGENDLKKRDPNTAAIKTSFIDIKKIERLVYLDNFYPSCQRILSSLVGQGLSNEALQVYRVTDCIYIQDQNIVKDMKKQYTVLALGVAGSGSGSVPRPVSSDQLKIAAMGCLRFINAAISMKAATNVKDLSLADKVFKNPALLKLLFLNQLPPRGSMSSLDPLPTNALSYMAVVRKLPFGAAELKTLLDFLNDENLVRTGKFRFTAFIAAHHFFSCELIQELFP